MVETREKYEKDKNKIENTLYSFKPSKDFENNKSDLSTKENNNSYSNSQFQIEREKMKHGREWLEKLDKDLGDIDKDQSKTCIKNHVENSKLDRSFNPRDDYSSIKFCLINSNKFNFILFIS